MDNETSPLGLNSTVSSINGNLKLTKFVADWWSAACYLQKNNSRFEPFEYQAFEYILNTPARGSVDEDKFGEAVNTIREIAYNSPDEFGEKAKDFAGKSGKILKDINGFAQTLTEVKRNSTVAVKEPTQTNKPTDSKERRTINADIWEGTFDANGTPYGSGTIHYADGSVYTGQWSAAGPHGNGQLVRSNGDVWNAQFKNGKPVNGEIKYANGDRYEGGLNERGRHGIGETYTETHREFGQYANDSRTGNGKILFRNGNSYEGGWNNHGANGQGSMYDSANKRTDSGDFINGKRFGQGRIVWAETSTCYEGTWRDTPRGMEGEGETFRLPNGKRSPVQYVEGKPMALTKRSTPSELHEEPGSYDFRNFIGIAGGLIFGLLTVVYFFEGTYGEMFINSILVLISQWMFVGKFNPRTGETTRKTYGSPIALTGIMFTLGGLIEFLGDGSGMLSLGAIIIGIISIIFAVKK